MDLYFLTFVLKALDFGQKTGEGWVQKKLQGKVDGLLRPSIEKALGKALSSVGGDNKSITRRFVNGFFNNKSIQDAVEALEKGQTPDPQLLYPLLAELKPEDDPEALAETLITTLYSELKKDEDLSRQVILQLPGEIREHFRGVNEKLDAIYDTVTGEKAPGYIFMVEDLSENFVKRPEEFEWLVDSLLNREENQQVAITAALKGAGGYGKTTLALAVCHDPRIIAGFPDGVLWITLGENPGNLTAKLNDLIERITGKRPGYIDQNVAASELSALLKKRSFLIVIDDVWNISHVRPFLRGGNNCPRLITTRNSDTLPLNCLRQDLDAMRREEAIQLLVSGVEAVPVDHAEKLAKMLGYWPLLLKLVNGVLRKRVEASNQNVLQAFQYVEKAIEKKGLTYFDATSAEARDAAVSKTMAVSLEHLSESDRARLMELAIFPEDLDIPLVTVHKLWQSADLDKFDTEELCQRLFNASLLLRLDLDNRTIRLHDVIRQFLIEQQKEILPELHNSFLEAYPVKNWWELDAGEPYLWAYLTYHLKQSGKESELKKLLFEYNWLQAKLDNRDVNSLLADFEYSDLDEDSSLLRDALRLSSHVLNRDKVQLPYQIWGRCRNLKSGNFERLLVKVKVVLKQALVFPAEFELTPPGGPLIRTLEGHTKTVRRVLVFSNATKAASVSDDKTLKIWDLSNGNMMYSFEKHSEPIKAIALNDNGTVAISSSLDKTLKVWDMNRGEMLYSLEGHSGPVNAVIISTSGKIVVSCSSDHTLKVWDLNTGKIRFTLEGHSQPVTSAAISNDERFVISASSDKTLKTWDLVNGKMVYSLNGHADWVNSVVLTSNGLRAVSTSGDCTLKVWDLTCGKLIYSLEGHSETVNEVALSDNGLKAVSASDDRTLKVWDLTCGKVIFSLNGHTESVRTVTLSADELLAFSASDDHSIKAWDLTNGKMLYSLNGHADSVRSISISSNGLMAVSASDDQTLKVWDLTRGGFHRDSIHHADWVNSIAIRADGLSAITASNDHTLKVWNLSSFEIHHTLLGHSFWVRSVVLSADGRLAVSSSDDRTLKVWDLESNNLQFSLEGHSESVRFVRLSKDNRRAISVSSDKTIRVWDLSLGKIVHLLEGHESLVNSLALTTDGQI